MAKKYRESDKLEQHPTGPMAPVQKWEKTYNKPVYDYKNSRNVPIGASFEEAEKILNGATSAAAEGSPVASCTEMPAERPARLITYGQVKSRMNAVISAMNELEKSVKPLNEDEQAAELNNAAKRPGLGLVKFY